MYAFNILLGLLTREVGHDGYRTLLLNTFIENKTTCRLKLNRSWLEHSQSTHAICF